MTTTRDNSQFVIATLSEFMRVWNLGEDASFHLETTKGHVTMAFSCKLGLPSAPHPIPTFPSPPPAKVKPHHRGPAQREKNRQRAALYQAAKVVQKPAAPAVTSSLSTPATVSVVTTAPSQITATVITPTTTSPVTTSTPVVVSSSSLTIQETIPSPCTTSTSSAGPVNGPSIPFIWIAAILTEKDVLKNCDRCQFSDHSLDQIRLHRQEKHRIWECLKCAESFHNKRSFVLHSCVLHPFSEKYYLSLKGR